METKFIIRTAEKRSLSQKRCFQRDRIPFWVSFFLGISKPMSRKTKSSQRSLLVNVIDPNRLFYASVETKGCTHNFITPPFFFFFSCAQAYTSQFVALVMFALMMCADRISMQPRRRAIIQDLKVLPGKSKVLLCWHVQLFINRYIWKSSFIVCKIWQF